jgi:hypothetical protein
LNTQHRRTWVRERHRAATGRAVQRFGETDDAAQLGVFVAAVISRLIARSSRVRREWRADRVPDADAVTITLHAGDRKRVLGRQAGNPWLLFDDLVLERDRPAPL